MLLNDVDSIQDLQELSGLRRQTILFIDNGTSYVLFLKLANHLQAISAVRFVFVTLIKARIDFFKRNGVHAVYLNVSVHPEASQQLRAEKLISQLERKNSAFRFDLSIRRDRILRLMPKKVSRRILFAAAPQFQDLIAQYKPDLILGEVSWAIEHLFYYISLEEGIRYRHILNIPGESLRIVAFDDRHSYASAIESSQDDKDNTEKLEKSYSELCEEVRSYKVSLKYFITRFNMDYSRNDYRQAIFYRIKRLINPFYEAVNNLFYYIHSEEAPNSSTGNILLALHIQPESTPDFVSPFFSDQLKIAQKLTDALQADQTLYIKDHPNKTSFRNLFNWWKLLRHPRTRLISRKVSGRSLYQKFDCVVSVAGTALLECSQLHVPSVCLSDVYLKELPGVFDARDFPNIAQAISTAIAYDGFREGHSNQVDQLINGLGFPGFVHDARVSPQVLEPENIARLSRLVEYMLKLAKP